jgi:hypothetical protein
MVEYIEKALSCAKNLIPPAEGACEKHLTRWRLWMAAATFLNAVGLSAHIALACGFAAPFYAGFVQASEFSRFKDDVQARRARELNILILDAKAKQCSASGDAKKLYFGVYNDLRLEYYELVGREFPDPPCADFAG